MCGGHGNNSIKTMGCGMAMYEFFALFVSCICMHFPICFISLVFFLLIESPNNCISGNGTQFSRDRTMGFTPSLLSRACVRGGAWGDEAAFAPIVWRWPS